MTFRTQHRHRVTVEARKTNRITRLRIEPPARASFLCQGSSGGGRAKWRSAWRWSWMGALQGPPEALRDASARLTEPRLKSEAGALAALSAWLPRGGARAGRYELAFPATR